VSGTARSSIEAALEDPDAEITRAARDALGNRD
jgi:hypothetical protein